MNITPKDIAEAEEIDFEEERERWNTYHLKDGTTLQIKTVLLKVVRLKRHNPDGTPVYTISTQNNVRATNIPDKLKAKPKQNTFKPI